MRRPSPAAAMSALKHTYDVLRREKDPSFGWILLEGHGQQRVRVKLNSEGVPLASALRTVGATEAGGAWAHRQGKAAQERWVGKQGAPYTQAKAPSQTPPTPERI